MVSLHRDRYGITPTNHKPMSTSPEDRSSCANHTDCHVKHYAFTWSFDFDAKRISATALLAVDILNESCTELILDSHESITISRVSLGRDPVEFEISPYCSFGQKLKVQLPKKRKAEPSTIVYSIEYETSGEPAVTWLTPEQTLGQKAPMCFSMGQACLNRALFPCQDTPAVRATFEATFVIARGSHSSPTKIEQRIAEEDEFSVACAAAATNEGAGGIFTYEMHQSLPPYLIGAFVIGRLAKRDVGPRSCVWAEPELVEAAAAEFDGVIETYLTAGEELFGMRVCALTQHTATLCPSTLFSLTHTPRLLSVCPPAAIYSRRSLHVGEIRCHHDAKSLCVRGYGEPSPHLPITYPRRGGQVTHGCRRA